MNTELTHQKAKRAFGRSDWSAAGRQGGLVVSVKGLCKAFKLPHEKRDTLKENVLNIFRKRTFEQFKALDDINLDIQKGDFIGIVGKNGSGKSTLLKVIAGIYTPGSGTVEVQGRIAPFLELGIGFQDELTARENIFINATLLGLTRKEIKTRFEEIVSFAEVGNFLDLKVKNYSSGMRARLAFAIAKEADADIYLCDEILAVGDEQFQQKCLNVFREWKLQGKTIILVSHNATLIAEFCNRAVLLENGRITAKGGAEDVLARYHSNMSASAPSSGQAGGVAATAGIGAAPSINERAHAGLAADFSDSDLRLTEVRFFTGNGEEKDTFATGESITARIFFKSNRPVTNPVFGIAIHRGDGTHITGPNTKSSLFPINKLDGDGYIDCVLENNGLLAGTYYFTASCFDYSCSYPYDYLDKKYRFTIVRNRDNQYGLVEIPVKWKINN